MFGEGRIEHGEEGGGGKGGEEGRGRIANREGTGGTGRRQVISPIQTARVH